MSNLTNKITHALDVLDSIRHEMDKCLNDGGVMSRYYIDGKLELLKLDLMVIFSRNPVVSLEDEA